MDILSRMLSSLSNPCILRGIRFVDDKERKGKFTLDSFNCFMHESAITERERKQLRGLSTSDRKALEKMVGKKLKKIYR